MTTLHKIEELLNIEIGDKVLRNGRIYNEVIIGIEMNTISSILEMING